MMWPYYVVFGVRKREKERRAFCVEKPSSIFFSSMRNPLPSETMHRGERMFEG